MKHIRVYKEDDWIGYFYVDENGPPQWIVENGIFLYMLRPKTGLIQNHCYTYVGVIETKELDKDID